MIKKFPMCRKRFYLSLFLVAGLSVCSAQDPTPGQTTAQTNQASRNDFWDQFQFGGGISLGFNNGGFNTSVSPGAIYQFSAWIPFVRVYF